MPVIQACDLTKVYRVFQKAQGLRASVRSLFRRKYKEVRAVDGISFEIEAGEMVGFLGPNGAGKTTTLKMLSGLIHPTSGGAEVLGFTPWHRKNEYRRRFALLMGQKNQLWWDLPAAESFRLHKEIYSLQDKPYRTVLDELTELLQITDLMNQPVRELSLGERMKMELVAALLHAPEILFLDEPTIGLDVVAQTNIRECLREYNRRRGVTIMLTSHYMQDVEAICDRVIVINHGRIIFDGKLASMMDRFAGYKILTVRFHGGEVPATLDGIGEVVAVTPPNVKFRLPRDSAVRQAAHILDRYDIEDITIEDPPIEEVIAEVFREPAEGNGPVALEREPTGA